MSLISESLKKAQLEAMRQDEQQRRSYFGSGRLDVPRERKPIVAIGIAAVGGAVIAASAFFFASQRATAAGSGSTQPVRASALAPIIEKAPVTETIATPVVAPDAVVPPLVVAVKHEAAPAPRTETPVPTRSEAVSRVASRPAQITNDGTGSDGGSVPAAPAARPAETAVPEKKPAAEKKPATRERDRLVDGKSYVSPIGAPGGMEISLSGVSSIGGKSVAIINGSVVREGSTVGPFVVEAIERGRVRLRYIDVRIWVTY